MPELTDAQRDFLVYGPKDAYDPAFEDERQVIEAWERNREELLRHAGGGHRPWGFRAIDRPDIPWRGYDKERSTNYAAGVLEPQERDELLRFWRAEFERAQELDDAAQRRHYKWADIPASLVKQWQRARRRKGKTIRAPGSGPEPLPPAV